MERYLKKSINMNDWSLGILSVAFNAEVTTELNYTDSNKPIIFKGELRKGIRKALDTYYGDRWILCTKSNPEIDLSEKYQVLEFIENLGISIGDRNKDLMQNLEWSEFSRLVKESVYLGKVTMEKTDNVFKFYESLSLSRGERLAHYLSMSMPPRLLESVLLTFIKKARNWEEVNTKSKKYKLMLKEFYDKNRNIDKVLIQYAVKSARYSVEDRLLWLILTLS